MENEERGKRSGNEKKGRGYGGLAFGGAGKKGCNNNVCIYLPGTM